VPSSLDVQTLASTVLGELTLTLRRYFCYSVICNVPLVACRSKPEVITLMILYTFIIQYIQCVCLSHLSRNHHNNNSRACNIQLSIAPHSHRRWPIGWADLLAPPPSLYYLPIDAPLSASPVAYWPRSCRTPTITLENLNINVWNVFYVHENCKFLIFTFSKVIQQYT